jgi:hypothetical protein
MVGATTAETTRASSNRIPLRYSKVFEREQYSVEIKKSRTPPLNVICALHFLARKVCSMQPLFYIYSTVFTRTYA